MIRILHLSDFHYKDKHDADFQDVGSKIADAIKDEHIDLVVFSGDLVYDTEQSDKIDKAAKCLIEPIKTVTGLDNDRILIAPGNHDMKIGAELPMIKQNFSTYKTYLDIDTFASNALQLELSLENFRSYNAFIKNFYGETTDVQPLYVCQTPVINGCRVGLIAFNSAWRCAKSNEDRGRLVYPVFMVRDALEKVKDCDFVICTQHHNLSDYTNSVGKEIEGLINEKCHMLLTGHYHRGIIQTTLYAETGLLHLTAPATYNRNDKVSAYGFNIIEMDTTIYEGTLLRYGLCDGSYKLIERKEMSVPVSGAKKEQNEFHKLMRIRHKQIKGRADALFLSGGQGSFDELFVPPVLTRRRAQEIICPGEGCETVTAESLLERGTSAIIFGADKSGKTTLLHWLQLETLKNCDRQKVIPFYINYQKYKSGKPLDLHKELGDFLRLDKEQLAVRFGEYRLLLLLDNMNPLDAWFVDSMKRQLKDFENARFVTTINVGMSQCCALLSFGDIEVEMYHIHDITRREVHLLTQAWPGIDSERKQIAEEKIMQMTEQLDVPLSFWTASLFLKTFAQADLSNIHDNFALLELFVDELLNKGGFIRNQEFIVDYDDVKSYMAEMAERIVHSEDYALTDKELNDFTEDFKPRNRDFTIATWDIIKFLLDHHIIHRVKDKYTIRLNGVFEFMLAFRMTEHERLLHDVISHKTAPIHFGHELGYYAGYRKNDFKTFATVFDKAKELMKPLTYGDGYQDVDAMLLAKVPMTPESLHSTTRLLEQMNGATIAEEYANTPPPASTEDQTLKPKVLGDTVRLNAANAEKTLFTLSRMYRNSNVCDNQALEQELFDFILTGIVNLGFIRMEEGEEFRPIALQRFLYKAIHQRNLHDVFASKLEKMLNHPDGNQMRIFLLTFMLVDMDIKKNFDLIDKADATIDNKVLRWAVLNKLIWLVLDNADNPAIKDALQPKISELAKEFGIKQ